MACSGESSDSLHTGHNGEYASETAGEDHFPGVCGGAKGGALAPPAPGSILDGPRWNKHGQKWRLLESALREKDSRSVTCFIILIAPFSALYCSTFSKRNTWSLRRPVQITLYWYAAYMARTLYFSIPFHTRCAAIARLYHRSSILLYSMPIHSAASTAPKL